MRSFIVLMMVAVLCLLPTTIQACDQVQAVTSCYSAPLVQSYVQPIVMQAYVQPVVQRQFVVQQQVYAQPIVQRVQKIQAVNAYAVQPVVAVQRQRFNPLRIVQPAFKTKTKTVQR